MNPDQRFNVICLSNQLWLKEYWTNKSHVMSRLAKQGHKVLFVEPPINTGNIFLREFKKGNWPLKRLLTQTKIEPGSGAFIYSPLNIVPDAVLTSKMHISRINKLTKNFFDPHLKTILWVYHVQMKELPSYIKYIKHDFLIYDCVDNYAAFPENNAFYSATINREQLLKQEADLAGKADMVFATAPELVERMQKFNSKTYFTPNVGDYEKFKNVSQIREIPEELRKIPEPRVGFSGALDEYKFDLELFTKCAQELPDVSFILIGSLARKGSSASLEDLGLKDLKNVHYLGPRPYADIHKYFAGFQAYIIPYQLNEMTIGSCFPVKFHDALAAGLPVVVTDMQAYQPFSDVCYISKTYDEFVSNIKLSLDENSAGKIADRQKVAKENSWEGKVARMLSLIRENISK